MTNELNEPVKKRNKTLPVVFGIILLIGAVFGVIKYNYAMHHEVTDDAQIENDINPVIARVSGYVAKINFEENQPVTKGDTLIILDDHDLRIKVDQADAAYQMAEAGTGVVYANVTTANAALESAEANVESARIKAKKAKEDYDHYENLIEESAISQQKYESVKADNETAQAQLKAAQGQLNAEHAKIEAAKKQVAVSQSLVNQRRADLELARLQLSYANIVAPVSGIASRKNVQPGQLVNAGTPLFAIVSDTGAYVIANFKETQMEKISMNQPVEIKVDAYPDTVFSGKVYAISPATGAKFSLLPPDNATGNFVKVVQRIPVKITINGINVRSKLRAGMSVKVAIKTD